MLIFAFVGIEYGTLWVFLSCNQAPEIAKFLAALSGAVTLLLIGVWMADLCWACLDDPQIENMHARQALPGAFPLARGPLPMGAHQSQWLASLFLQAVTWLLLILWLGAHYCPY